MKSLLVVDAINGFCRSGFPLSLPVSTTAMESYIAARIDETRAGGGSVVFVCDSHTMDDPEIGAPYPPHCLVGTEEAQIVESLRSRAAASIVIPKSTLSVFHGTRLGEVLGAWDIEEVEVAGVCTEICVLFAVYELRIRGHRVVVSHRGVLPLDSRQQREHLEYFAERLGAHIVE